MFVNVLGQKKKGPHECLKKWLDGKLKALVIPPYYIEEVI